MEHTDETISATDKFCDFCHCDCEHWQDGCDRFDGDRCTDPEHNGEGTDRERDE